MSVIESPTFEQWRPWRDGAYEVSDQGRVRRAKSGHCTIAGFILKPILLRIGYYKVSPVINGKNRQTYIHNMIAEVFIGPKPDGYSVNHKDGIKTNNAASNLEYVTHLGNMQHAAATGLSAAGEQHGLHKLTDNKVRAMRAARRAGESLTSVASRFGVAKSTASQVINARRWRHI